MWRRWHRRPSYRPRWRLLLVDWSGDRDAERLEAGVPPAGSHLLLLLNLLLLLLVVVTTARVPRSGVHQDVRVLHALADLVKTLLLEVTGRAAH